MTEDPLLTKMESQQQPKLPLSTPFLQQRLLRLRSRDESEVLYWRLRDLYNAVVSMNTKGKGRAVASQ